MGTPINSPLTSEIWHLTIDDLLEPLPASPRLGGPGPFVINLSASTAPISVPMKSVAEHPGTHVYQIQRTEDRRVRYRLRLGPFETEAEAEALLATVREIYPSALTASATSRSRTVVSYASAPGFFLQHPKSHQRVAGGDHLRIEIFRKPRHLQRGLRVLLSP